MFNLIMRPIEPETLEDWKKISIDIAKVAILAIPVIFYGKVKINQLLLTCCCSI